MGFKSKIFFVMLSAGLLIGALPAVASAKSTKVDYTAKTSGSGDAITVRSVSYEREQEEYGNGYVGEFDIDFSGRVEWKDSAKVASVKDSSKKSYKASLTDRDDDDCEVTIQNPKAGTTYTISIQGIKKLGTSSFRTLTLKVTVPSSSSGSKALKVVKVTVDEENDDYDSYPTEIEVSFSTRVTWKKGAKITSVKDNKRKSYKAVLTDKDDDDCEIYIKNLKYGRTYTIKISGVKAIGASSWQTLTVKAKVPAKSNKIAVKDVEYDADYDDGQPSYTIDIDFNKNVDHKSSSYVIVKDSKGKAYSSKGSYIEWGHDECEVHLSRALTKGKTYTYQIVNVKARKETKYTTLKGSFKA